MSASRMFSVIGDANITRNMTGLNMASREVMGNSQVLECVSMSTMDQALNDVRGECKAHANLGAVHLSLSNYINAIKCFQVKISVLKMPRMYTRLALSIRFESSCH